MIRIPDDTLRRMRVLAGAPHALSDAPAPVFDAARIDFLADLSRLLLAHPEGRTLPDVATFAFWCRRANLMQLATRFGADNRLRMGAGLSFHICPSNVPVNFAFSMAFGLLTGNACVLRLPSRASLTADILVAAIAELLGSAKHAPLAHSVLLSQFERDDDVNRFWLATADARVVWGGDQTVQHMRGLPCKPRSREVAFTDRYSFCTLAPEAVLALDATGIQALCGKLYNDLYLMDQAACSSPQLLAWIGDAAAADAARARLWPVLAEHAASRYQPEPVQLMDKYVDACRHALGNEHVQAVTRHGNVLYRLELSGVAADQHTCRGYFGTIHEIALPTLDALAPIVNERYQTLTSFGLAPSVLREFIVSQKLRGIDRVVPVGHALDMGLVWDGYDIVASLSRIIDIQTA